METKYCSHHKCEHPIEDFGINRRAKDGRQYWCKKAFVIYFKKRRRINPQKVRAAIERWEKKHPDGLKAKAIAQRLVKKGIIVKPALCEDCQKVPPAHMHHDDYSKPEVVAHLCCSCHRLRHVGGLDGER